MTDADIGAELAAIVEEAAALILPLWRTGLTVETKTDDSPVTEADRRGEALIVDALTRRWPDIPVIAEEAVSGSGAPDTAPARFFLVDPLDGTKAFVRGETHYTVNIGLVIDRRPAAGAVCAPATGETWFTAGHRAVKRTPDGAERPIRVRAPVTGSVLALTSHTLKPEQWDAMRARYGVDVREPMDSSIKFCRIAEGAADIYPRHGPTMEWDIAAGHAVLEAAGGRVIADDGGPFLYGKADAGFRNGWFVAYGG